VSLAGANVISAAMGGGATLALLEAELKLLAKLADLELKEATILLLAES